MCMFLENVHLGDYQRIFKNLPSRTLKKILARKINHNLSWLPHRRKIKERKGNGKKVREKEALRSIYNSLRKEWDHR